MNALIMKSFDDAVECARLLGATDAKRGYGHYKETDSRFCVAMYQAITKHRNVIDTIIRESKGEGLSK